MTLQILSDLHLESPKAYDVFEVVPRAPYLVLLGEVGTVGPHRAELLAFFTAQLRQFRAVLLVLATTRRTTLAGPTYWSPTRDPRVADPRHANSAITSAFATDLSGEKCFRSGKVKLWVFGHTHWNCDLTVERRDVEPLRLVTD
ncbi:hypothetical protein RB595_007746 [Gaeumannomyces hyphopodioides]